jgi:solute carrier family 6 GABA transporter-like protein 1
VVFTWVCVFFCVFKGVKSSSYVVWVTVPLPILFIIIMVIRNAMLPGAGDGILMYIAGKGSKYTAAEALALPNIWSEACGQIFFSIGVCMGIMTSYGSYNPRTQPIIGNNLIISISNSLISIVSGFAVFSIIGYLAAINSPLSSKTSSTSLAFIAYPSACIEMPGSNFWAILLAITLFTLGIDSAFSLIEAVSTVIYDTERGGKFPRMFIALVLCVIGCGISALFCTNWGYILLDIVDHYVSVYLMIFLGIVQCFGVGWGNDADKVAAKYGAKPLWILALGYWVPLLLMAILSFFAFPEYNWVGFIVFFVCWHISIPIAKSASGIKTMGEFINEIYFCGPKSLAEEMCVMGRKGVEITKDTDLRDEAFIEADIAAKQK